MRKKDIPRKTRKLFWVYVNKTAGCWLWAAGSSAGYGVFHVKRKVMRAHRVAYILANGSIPKGLLVCHSCDNPLCVNPDHLWVGTQKDNMKDAREKGRTRKGENHGASRLNDNIIQIIRNDYSAGRMNQPELAKRFNVSQKNISKVVRRETWRHVQP